MELKRDEALRLLRGGAAGIREWNARRGQGAPGFDPRSIAPGRGAMVLEIDLSEADLRGADLRNAILVRTIFTDARFEGANLDDASFGDAILRGADFTQASLARATLGGTDLMEAIFYGANLTDAFLQRASLFRTDFRQAKLIRSNLELANLVEATLVSADLIECLVYGLSAWDLNLSGATQKDLIITRQDESPSITVDSLEVAQFIYLLLANQKIRHVIETVTSKVVLILGRFTPDRKLVLDAVREELRKQDYCPVMFDFEKPATRSFIETVSILGHMARFVIADFTDAKIVLQEVEHISTSLVIPILPLMQEGAGPEPSTLADIRRGRTNVLKTHRYASAEALVASLAAVIIEADSMARGLAGSSR